MTNNKIRSLTSFETTIKNIAYHKNIMWQLLNIHFDNIRTLYIELYFYSQHCKYFCNLSNNLILNHLKIRSPVLGLNITGEQYKGHCGPLVCNISGFIYFQSPCITCIDSFQFICNDKSSNSLFNPISNFINH